MVSPELCVPHEMINFIDDESSGYKTPNIPIEMIDVWRPSFYIFKVVADCTTGSARVGFFC